MHLVSSEGVTGAAQQTLFMPMMTRMPKQRVKMLVISLSPNAVPGAVLRQNGVPVYDVALSKQRFSTSAFGQLIKTVHAFRPDVIQAWGHTAQIVSTWLQKRCDWETKLVWSVSATAPLGRKPGLIDQQKLKYAAKFSSRAHSIVYTSEAAASAHRRAGFPEDGHTVVPLGVDPTRFKPDFNARRKVREQLGLPEEAFVIGMMAPFQPEYDYPTLLKAVGELIKTDPNIAVLLAGHGVQKGNAPLMALVGGGTLGTRTQLLGEWSDVASFFNACDLACSSALTDNGRMSLVMAMLCGVPCVATGMGAQGEVIGQHGVAVEPGSATALIRGITRVMQLTPEKRVFMAQGARKHALANYVSIRSLQKYLQLYYDLVGRKLTAATAVPAPEIDATIPTPTAQEREAMKNVAKAKPKQNKAVDMYELRDPDSLESRDLPTPEERAAKNASEGDVLNLFESSMAKQASSGTSPMSERARGVADEHEDLLAPELLSVEADAKSPVAVEPAIKPIAVPEQKAQVSSIAKEEPKNLAPTEKAKPVEVAKPSIADAAVSTAPEPAKVELSLLDTMSFSVQFNSTSATGTLEIPSDLIFTPAPTKPVATSAPVAVEPPAKQVVDSAPPSASIVEAVKPAAPAAEVVAPLEIAAPLGSPSEVIAAPTASIVEAAPPITSAADLIDPIILPIATTDSVASMTADSATVPALQVDALLSSTAEAAVVLASENADREAIQLDLLGEPSDLPRVAAS